MISRISMWSKGIIIAVIIGTIIEMILPDNKNKKYIKVVIGVYVLFCIISPVIGSTFSLNEIEMEKYLFLNESSTQTNLSNNNESVDRIFQENINKQIQSDLQKFGYDSNKIEVKTDDKYNILSIEISNIIEYKEKTTMINTIEINIKDKPAKGIPTSDKDKIIEHLKTTYKVDKDNIKIT